MRLFSERLTISHTLQELVVTCGGTGNQDACLKKVQEMFKDKELINRINEALPLGDTALTSACREGNSKIVQYLLTQNADPNASNNRGEIPMNVARDEAIKDILWEKLANDKFSP